MDVIVHESATPVSIDEGLLTSQVLIDDPTIVQVEISAVTHEVTVEAPVTTVTVVEDNSTFEVTVVDESVSVIAVAQVGPSGPAGPQGPPGLAGGLSSAVPPLQADAISGAVSLAPGTTVGQGLIWTGGAWVARSIVPSGTGTVPFTSGDGFAGDTPTLRYAEQEQALYVPRLGNTLLDGGNF